VAKIQAELLTHQVDNIRPIYYSEDKELYISAAQHIGKGSWTSSTEYYNDLAHRCSMKREYPKNGIL
jgi:hypothetical protein